jgi:hypothetical protein
MKYVTKRNFIYLFLTFLTIRDLGIMDVAGVFFGH